MRWTRRMKRSFRLERDRLRVNRFISKYPDYFEGLETYCFFIGYPRSSHSLVGSLLDAHPEAAIAHEQDALYYINNGFNREQLYALLLKNARKIGRKGRQQTGYSYQVPGQYQGTWEKLRVIGDKRGGNTSRWLWHDPSLLKTLQDTIHEQLRVIHISRNPFDNIATMVYHHVKGQKEKMTQDVLQKQKWNYLELAKTVERTRRQLNEEEFCHISINDFLNDPDYHLRQLVSFLGLTEDQAYIDACKSILFKQPNQSRWQIHWPEAVIDEVEATIQDLPCLQGYRFKD